MEETPTPRKLPPFRSFIPFAVLLAIIGWSGIYYLISSTLPTLGPRWLFFFFLTLAMTGSGLPVIVFLNIRFPSYPPIDTPVVIRQACWIGVFSGVIAWLQLGRILTPAIGVIIAVGLVVIEGLIRLREKSKWNPASSEPTADDTPLESPLPPEDNTQ